VEGRNIILYFFFVMKNIINRIKQTYLNIYIYNQHKYVYSIFFFVCWSLITIILPYTRNLFSFFVLMIETLVLKSTFKIIRDTSHTIIEGRRKNRNMNEWNNRESKWSIITRKLYKNNKITNNLFYYFNYMK
jgi:hypothetical protein